MNLFDFGHSLLTGKWRLDREIVQDQRERYYAGARRSINRPYPQPLSGTEDYRKASERIVLIRAAREMEEDGGFFDGILDDFETYVIGDQLQYMPNTGNPDADKVIREYLEWQFDQCDYSQRHDLTKLAQLAERTLERDGECGFVPVDVGDAIKLHTYEADCIGNPTMASSTQPFDYNGIIVDDRTNSPVRYNLFKRAPKTAQYTFDRAIQAEHFWHLFDAFRLHQFHGVSAFKNSIRDAYDIDQILEFTKINIKSRSSELPTVHTPDGKPKGPIRNYGFNDDPANPVITAGGDPKLQIEVDGVTRTFYNLEDKVVEYPNDFPNAQLGKTIEELRRQSCKGAKLPYEFVYRADSGGVVQRFWVDKAKNTFDRKKHIIRRVLINPYKNRSIQKGIDTGELDLSSFGDLDVSLMRYRGAWQMGKEVAVDYRNDNLTDIALMDAGCMSLADKAASMNRSIDDINIENETQTDKVFAMARRTADKYGIDIREALPFYQKKFPNQAGVSPQAGEGADELVQLEIIKARLDAYGVGVRAGAITPSEDDENFLRDSIGLPKASGLVRKAWEDEGVRRPITITPPPGEEAAPLPTPAEEMKSERKRLQMVADVMRQTAPNLTITNQPPAPQPTQPIDLKVELKANPGKMSYTFKRDKSGKVIGADASPSETK